MTKKKSGSLRPRNAPLKDAEDARDYLRCNSTITQTGCWELNGLPHARGYVHPRHNYNKRKWFGHRLSWTVFVGEIPEGLCICHRCDNRRCVNPQHLFIGTKKENNLDMIQKGRAKAGNRPIPQKGFCTRGHAITGENARKGRIEKDGSHDLVCNICYKTRRQSWLARRQA